MSDQTDRELLELAAKAAGLEVSVAQPSLGACLAVRANPVLGWFNWSPLTDDGDALRLAVKLGIFDRPEFFHFLSLERFGKQEANDYAATRRAIVRAAAAIAQNGATK